MLGEWIRLLKNTKIVRIPIQLTFLLSPMSVLFQNQNGKNAVVLDGLNWFMYAVIFKLYLILTQETSLECFLFK